MDVSRSKPRRTVWWIVLTVVPIVCGVLAMGLGRLSISIPEILACFFPGLFPEVAVSDAVRITLFNIRMPRVLLALIAGAGLSVAGASFQSIFSNPLATPDTLGVAAGASFGAALGILLRLPAIGIQFAAVGFGLAAVAVVYIVSRIKGISSIIMIILAGMVVGALFSALVSLIKYVADPQDTLPAITFWLMGSLSGTSMERLAVGSPLMIAGTIVIFLMRWRLNAMTLNEDEAKSLGVNVKLVRAVIVTASTMVTAAVISMCGIIGWVGLLIPHMARMIFGNDNRLVIPACVGLGALFLLLIDTLARSATAAEIPVSILTAVIGAPFFIILLRKTGGIRL